MKTLNWDWLHKSGGAISFILLYFPMVLCVSFVFYKNQCLSQRSIFLTVGILAWCSLTKIQTMAMVKQKLPDMPPKCTNKVWSGVLCTQILPSDHDVVATFIIESMIGATTQHRATFEGA